MGWNGSNSGSSAVVKDQGRKPSAKAAPSFKKGIVAGLIVVVGAGLAAWWIGRPGTSAPTKAKKAATKQIAEVKPQIVTQAVEVAEKKVEKPEKPKFVKRPGALQLKDGTELTFPPPKEGETRLVHAYGHTYECDHLGNFTDITPRQLFHTAFEANFLALSCEGRSFIPAFLTGLDQEEVKKVLEKNYVPIGDETEDEMQQLKNYDEMRCAALQYMEEGGSFDDFVTEFATFEKKQRNARATSLREVMTLYKEGRVQEAKAMAEASDVLMAKEGYKPLQLPPRVQADFDKIP